eukprot:jgi/Tetstr1/431805/TSEL_021300.t1
MLVSHRLGAPSHRRAGRSELRATSRRSWLTGNAAILGAGLTSDSRAAGSSMPGSAGQGCSVESLWVSEPAARVGYTQRMIQVGADTVPVAVWYPSASGFDGASPPREALEYTQRTSFGKLVRTFLKIPVPGWLLNSDKRLRASSFVTQGMEPTSGALPAVVLAHGFLGSRFDMLHLAERLAAQGMVVMSPEFPDARSGEVTADPSSMGQPATRQDILLATMADLQTQFSVTRVGLLGHSAGSGTISRLPGVYARVSVAGLVPQPESQPEGPFLVVHSSGDSTIAFQGGMEAVRARLASGAYTFLSAESEQDRIIKQATAAPQRLALLLSRPNHISFLSERSNDAMLSTLAFLLPVARMLNLRLLDFDKYYESRDSRETARVYVPVVERFLVAHLAGNAGSRI